jgi:hypothetical protein
MRFWLFTGLLLTSLNGYCQKWWTCNIDSSAEFKYQYCFQFTNKNPHKHYSLDKIKGSLNSKIKLHDVDGNLIQSATIRITSLNKDSPLLVKTDLNGTASFYLQKGVYNVLITAENNENFNLKIPVANNTYFILKVILYSNVYETIYQINSKDKLEDKEIQRIIRCVKRNGHLKCNGESSYNLTIQV